MNIPDHPAEQRKLLSKAMQYKRYRQSHIRIHQAEGTAQKVKAVEHSNRVLQEIIGLINEKGK